MNYKRFVVRSQRRIQGAGAGGARPPFFAVTCLFCNHFEELQSVSFKVELVINNELLTCVYPNTIKTCLTSNYLLFGRQLYIFLTQHQL